MRGIDNVRLVFDVNYNFICDLATSFSFELKTAYEKSAGFFAIIFLMVITGCGKEYSYEGSDRNGADTTVRPPTPPAAVTYNFPVCLYCNTLTSTDLSTWSFKMENTMACGKADTAIVAYDRTGFTFFGPSSCSVDTGIIITVYLKNYTLNRDIPYLFTDRVAFYYYDRVTPSYIFMSQTYSPFSVMIENYYHQTKIAEGSFTGFANRSDGRPVSINPGKFKIKLL